jgi:hypothetical protein
VAANTNANVRIWLDGQILGTFPRLISAGANQSYQQTTTAWYARPGEHTLEFRVDTGNVIAEADETDNVATFMFTALDPNLATKFVDPIGGVILQDWAVSAYVDVDLRSGSCADASGGSVAYDGHTGNDLFLSQLFSAMDRGLGIFAVADGTVIAVQDGYFDREVTLTSMNWNAVILDHGNGFLAAYGHMATNTVAVKEGDHVTAGQLLGLVGSSGYTNGAHRARSLYGRFAHDDPGQRHHKLYGCVGWRPNSVGHRRGTFPRERVSYIRTLECHLFGLCVFVQFR